jgi:hypothetical protein
MRRASHVTGLDSIYVQVPDLMMVWDAFVGAEYKLPYKWNMLCSHLISPGSMEAVKEAHV